MDKSAVWLIHWRWLALVVIVSQSQLGYAQYGCFESRQYLKAASEYQHQQQHYSTYSNLRPVCHLPPVHYSLQESGICSWYSAPPGALTASGEPFDPSAMTAAHRTLPFGTHVQVSIPSLGTSAVVRINDRGPFVPGRILDLTPAGASVLGFTDRGIVQCNVVTI